MSALEAELAARLPQPRPLVVARYRGRRRVAQRLRGDPARSAAPATLASGRWAPVHRAGVLGRPLPPEERGRRLAEILLARYGVLTRDAAEREELSADWPALYAQLQRMEMRGEVRRGYFVSGLPGAQFALPEAVEKVRTAASGEGGAEPGGGPDALVVLNAADPANLYGLAETAPEAGIEPLRFARLPSTHLVLSAGRPLLIVEDNGERMSLLPGYDPSLVQGAIEAYLARPNAPRHVVVTQWNGAPVLGSAGEALLQAAGFYRSPAGMERWAGR